MNMQTTSMWMNAIVVFIVGVAPLPTLVQMSTTMTDPALGDHSQSAALLDDDRRDGESTVPCTTDVASTPQSECEQYRSLRDLDSEAYASEYEDCDCDILIFLCRLTDTYTDFVTVVADDGTEISSEVIVSCEYGGCGVEVDLE